MTNNTEPALAESVANRALCSTADNQGCTRGKNVCQVCGASLTAVYRDPGFGDTCAVLEKERDVYLVASKGERFRGGGLFSFID